VVNLYVVFVLRVGAAALGRQVELASSRADVPADSFLADTVVGRCVNEIDAGVEHGVEETVGIFFTDDPYAPSPRAAKSHAAITELGDFEIRTAKSLSYHVLSILIMP
jgi:hypothetical protein